MTLKNSFPLTFRVPNNHRFRYRWHGGGARGHHRRLRHLQNLSPSRWSRGGPDRAGRRGPPSLLD
eukprot:6225940-Pyramimonas_sp.AAC.1